MDFHDILGLRYAPRGTDPATGVDCMWASRRALERVFPDFQAHELPLFESEEAAALALARQGFSSWQRLGGSVFVANRLGDLVIGDRPDGGLSAAVMIDLERREFLTATPELGVCVLPARKLARTRDVFRRRPA